ncbi:MAG TPA: acyltransferase [Acidimicrobiia bacterium]|nr:acyltransferase [Acidimicrobiia bacterium]
MRRPSGRIDAGRGGRARHIPALDGLRGAAVGAVLLFHAGNLTGGWLGVDLFFVLSGFLITSLLIAERTRRDRISLSAFWARRGRRLLPALFLVLIGVGVYAVVWAAPRELAQIRGDGFATLGYVANWHQIGQGHSYWDLFRAPSPLEHTWSLAIEEQFYLVWPVVLVGLFAWGRAPRRVLIAATVGVVASFATMLILYHPGANPQRVYLGTDTRASSILIGAALAALVATRGWTGSRNARTVLETVGVVSLGFLAWAWLRLSGTTPAVYQGLLLACSLAAGLVIAAAAHPRTGLVARVFSIRPLRALGVISYGVYLWHWPVYLVADSARVGLSGWPLTTVRIGITLAIAVASYSLVESPIRHGALAGWRIRVLAPAALAAALVVVVVATIPPAPPHTNPVSALRHLTAAADRAKQTPSAPSPPSSAPARPFKVMVTGDSVALRLVPAFQSLGGPLAFHATDRTEIGCGLERGATAHRLADGSAAPADVDCSRAWSSAVARDRPDVAFVSLAGQVVGDWQVNGRWIHPCQPAYDQWFQHQVVDALSILTRGGARVALALAAPSFGPDFFARDECIRTAERAATTAVPGASTVDFKDLICPQNHCINTIDGITLRADGMHYEGPAAELIVQWLVPRLRLIAAAPPPP